MHCDIYYTTYSFIIHNILTFIISLYFNTGNVSKVKRLLLISNPYPILNGLILSVMPSNLSSNA